jgi:hypothetical protein
MVAVGFVARKEDPEYLLSICEQQSTVARLAATDRGAAAPHVVNPEIEMKILYKEATATSFMLRLKPGAKLPSHVHAAD